MERQPAPHAVVLFDGVCNLCNAGVQFIIPRDPRGYFRFAALDSGAAARAIAAAGGLPPGTDSIVLIQDGRLYVRSAAALRIARRLAFPWPLTYGMVLVPRFLRDWAYDIVARNRLAWFGRRDVCLIPAPGIRDRFLD